MTGQNLDQFQKIREEYKLDDLLEAEVAPDPIDQFKVWFDYAVESGIREPNGMTLSTVNGAGRPSARVVLLKSYDTRGFVFYTNYTSRKGQELAVNRNAALTFWWPALERQVRVEGEIDRVSPEESDTYYNSRPVGSRLGAWTSPQSETIPDRNYLQARYADIENRFQSIDNPPRPDFWGGYRLVPHMIEFWQGRSSRLHDRILYQWGTKKGWEISRLAP
ncbi:MAG: pyridoxamine 5'-phosphate oxidase [Chloroflexota bacterium]